MGNLANLTPGQWLVGIIIVGGLIGLAYWNMGKHK